MVSKATNKEILAAFSKAQAVLQVIDDKPFRVRAYHRAIETIEQLDSELSSLMKRSQLTDLPGIGVELAAKIEELVKTGRSEALERLYAKVPAGMFALMTIPSLGPKKAYKLSVAFDLDEESSAISRLLLLAREHRVQELDGFAAQSEAKIIDNIAKVKAKSTRMRLDEAEVIAQRVLAFISQIPEVDDCSTLGSIRRRRETVGDVDIGVATRSVEAVVTRVKQAEFVEEVQAAGGEVVRIVLKDGVQVDLKFMHPDQWGSMLQHFTGSKHHNVALRELAIKQGKSLSEKGSVFEGELHQFASEELFYAHLGLSYIPPELREGVDEVVAAQRRQIPNLISLDAVLGDTHTHTNYDWKSSHDYGAPIEALLDVALGLGYTWIALGDHQPSRSSYAVADMSKLVVQRSLWIEQQYCSWKESVKDKTRIPKVLKTLEVDIAKDGSLALPDDACREVDFIIASVHSGFDLDEQTQTNRLIRAIEHPRVKIIGHPTGRLLLNRNPMAVDWDRVFAACVACKVGLEINASPSRLDLPDSLVRRAHRAGVMLTLGSDAHNQSELRLMGYAVDVARRGWLSKNDILNTRTYSQVKHWLSI